jgi:hypothetical protein
LTEVKQRELLKLLQQGNSCTKAAKAVGVERSTITQEALHDAVFAVALDEAVAEGRKFRRIFQRLFEPGRVRLEHQPVISTPQFEEEKEFLISRGLSREWISRMRLVTWDELVDIVEADKFQCGREERKGLLADLEKARNSLCGEEFIEERFSPDGRRHTVLKTRRRLPPSESVLANRVASLEMALELSGEELEQLLDQIEQGAGRRAER